VKITAEFVTSAAAAADLPRDGLAEVALVGRSNVGKSSLINALARQRVARTSAAPGKTRLANFYRLARGGGSPFYLVDLPGFGYARGGDPAAREFAELTRQYFTRGIRLQPDFKRGDRLQPDSNEAARAIRLKADPASIGAVTVGALLLVDARHPGLDSDVEAWRWLRTIVEDAAVVATKIDKLGRGERIRATRELESVFEHSVLPVSAVTGEGLDELWKLIDRVANSRKQPPSRDSRPSQPPRAAMAPRPRKK
jgi:GTP-binding protein